MLGDHSRAPSITLLALVFAYSVQIFADFAGYSLIAIGLARAFGYELMNNFNFPYLTQTFSEFWPRWHMKMVCIRPRSLAEYLRSIADADGRIAK